MVNLAKYPNPLRLFTQTRDTWFTKFVESMNVPMHIFTSIRDTQLGQLVYAIETHRLKQIRAGEDPGPSFLSGDSVSSFIPLLQTTKMMQDFLKKEEIGIETSKIKKEFLTNEIIREFKKVKKTDSDWFTTLDEKQLDILYIPAAKVILEVIVPMIGEKLELEKIDEIIEKIKELDPNFGNTLFNICDPTVYNSILEATWTTDKDDDKTRLIPTEDEEPIKLHYNDYHTRTNVLHSFVLELIRIIESGKKYSLNFDYIPQLLTLEMLIMIPQPDKTRLPLVKQHLDEMKKIENEYPSEFWELPYLSYQAFSHVLEPQQRMFHKLYKSIEKNFKQTARTFWKKILTKLQSEEKKIRDNSESLLPLLWCHFRVVQAQAQQISQNKEKTHQNYAYRAMLRFEHIFWQQGKEYMLDSEYHSKIHFWSTYASIANKEIRSSKDSLDSFNQFDNLFMKTKILTNKTQRKKYDITLRDHKSVVQTVLSYGIEGKDVSIYPELKEYNKRFEQILDQIEEETDDYPDISLNEERNAVKSIYDYLEKPLIKDETPAQERRGRPVRRLRQ